MGQAQIFLRAVLTEMTPSTSLIVDIFLFTFRIFSYPNACSKVKKILFLFLFNNVEGYQMHPNRFDFPILPELFLKDTYNLFHSVILR